jgi:hypothetical protein
MPPVEGSKTVARDPQIQAMFDRSDAVLERAAIAAERFKLIGRRLEQLRSNYEILRRDNAAHLHWRPSAE